MKKTTSLLFAFGLLLVLAAYTPRANTNPDVWAAKVFQSTTNAPVATVIHNDYGFDLVLTRDAAGIYTVTSPQPIFTEGKVFITHSGGDAFTLQRAFKVFNFSNNANILKIFVMDFEGVYQDTWTLWLKVEVYP